MDRIVRRRELEEQCAELLVKIQEVRLLNRGDALVMLR